jgi:hypothetical protein
VNLVPDAIERLHNPPKEQLYIANGGVRHSISTWLALEHSSQQSFERLRCSTQQNLAYSWAIDNLLSYHKTERVISQYTGVEAIEHDMCPSSCVAFTGPFADLDECLICQASRWDQAKLKTSTGKVKQGARRALTIPLGLQLQACYCHPDSARDMKYLNERTKEILSELCKSRTIPAIDDISMGHDYLGAYLAGDIKPNDVVVSISLDGAQLYEKKQSDCWIYIWIILNLSPDKRYRNVNVLPGRFIPGPNKPKNLDSFLFPGLHHLAALQNEGLTIWDASSTTTFRSYPYLMFITADGPGLVHLNGTVGHSGKNRCRMYCGILSQRKRDGTHYYPALLMPWDHCAEGSDHPDINVFHLPTGGQQDYVRNLFTIVSSSSARQCDIRKTETGLTAAPLILGLQPPRSLGRPLSMTTDSMHLMTNLSTLLIGLWRAGSVSMCPRQMTSPRGTGLCCVVSRHGKLMARQSKTLVHFFLAPSTANPATSLKKSTRATRPVSFNSTCLVSAQHSSTESFRSATGSITASSSVVSKFLHSITSPTPIFSLCTCYYATGKLNSRKSITNCTKTIFILCALVSIKLFTLPRRLCSKDPQSAMLSGPWSAPLGISVRKFDNHPIHTLTWLEKALGAIRSMHC